MYTKLFETITDSTIWCEDSDTRVVWVTMLAMADKHGEVRASLPGLAKRAQVPLPAVEVALEKFLSPDKYSMSQDFEGRRIKTIEGGWLLLNYAKYQEIKTAEERREYHRVYAADRRAKKKNSQQLSTPVNNLNTSDTDTDLSGKIRGDLYSSSPPVDEQGNTSVNTPSPYKNPQTYTQEDFEERDQKLLAKAKKEVLKRAAANVGNGSFTEAEFMTAVCEESGLTPQRVKKLEDVLKWR